MEIDFEEILDCISGGAALYEVGTPLKTLMFTDGIPRMQGFTREEYEQEIAEDAMHMVFEADRPYVQAAITRAVEKWTSIKLSYRVYCKDGNVIWVNLAGYPAKEQPKDAIVYQAVFTNVTTLFNLYQDVCDNSATGALVFAKDTLQTYYVNAAVERLTGIARSEGVERRPFYHFIPELTDAERQQLLAKKSEFIHKIIANGHVLHIYSRTIHWQQRESVIVYLADVTSEYRKQEKLQKSYEEQVSFSRILSSISVASAMINLTQNSITLQEAEKKEILSAFTKQKPQQAFEAMCQHIPDPQIRSQYAVIFNTGQMLLDFDKGITKKSIRHPYDSMDYWLEASYDAVLNPKTGEIEVYYFEKDVTQDERQKSITKSLVAHEYESVMLIHPGTGQPTVLVDDGTTMIFEEQERAEDCQKGLENYFLKYSADRDPKKAADEASLNAVKKALEKQDIYTISYSVYDKKHRIVRKRSSFSYLNQYKTMILCTVQDITSDFENEVAQREKLKNALDEAHRAMKAKTDFLSNMSHDMRTPMNAILGLSNLAMDVDQVDELKDYMRKIRASGNQLLSLINDTLDVSRIENGKLVMNREYIMSERLFTEASASAQVIAEEKDVHFETVKQNVENILLYADVIKVTKILTNLLSNAVKFTPEGGMVTFSIRCLKSGEHQAEYLIRVKDTGIGMSREFLNHIYEPFSQERADYSTNASGTGLGMTIVHELTAFLGGRIEIRSELSKGTEVSLFLSFEIADECPEKEVTPMTDFPSASGRLLVAEDHALNAQIIKKILENYGYQVHIVENGQECVNTFTQAKPEEYAAILMDIRMPVMDGIQATKVIRGSNRKDAGTIPIIAMTANAFEQDVRDCMAAGMNAHLSKPIMPELLYQTLRQYVKA